MRASGAELTLALGAPLGDQFVDNGAASGVFADHRTHPAKRRLSGFDDPYAILEAGNDFPAWPAGMTTRPLAAKLRGDASFC